MNKLISTLTRIQIKIDEYKECEIKPVFYWNWIRRKIKIESQIIKNKYHE